MPLTWIDLARWASPAWSKVWQDQDPHRWWSNSNVRCHKSTARTSPARRSSARRPDSSPIAPRWSSSYAAMTCRRLRRLRINHRILLCLDTPKQRCGYQKKEKSGKKLKTIRHPLVRNVLQPDWLVPVLFQDSSSSFKCPLRNHFVFYMLYFRITQSEHCSKKYESISRGWI